jgi:hypothetical protein
MTDGFIVGWMFVGLVLAGIVLLMLSQAGSMLATAPDSLVWLKSTYFSAGTAGILYLRNNYYSRKQVALAH